MNQKVNRLLRAVAKESGKPFKDLVQAWRDTPQDKRKMISLEMKKSLKLCKEITAKRNGYKN